MKDETPFGHIHYLDLNPDAKLNVVNSATNSIIVLALKLVSIPANMIHDFGSPVLPSNARVLKLRLMV